ncbi:MAG TPA: hypothetical protein VFD77_07620 [Brumimicrobium sp.]|nr:hypothetical protein [Brumimicrobium sp.]
MKEDTTTKEGIEEVKRLANSYMELIKVRSVRKTSEVATGATYGLITFILIIMCFSFFGFALAIYIGDLLESQALGFLIVGAVPLLAILIMRLFNKHIFSYLLNFFTRIMTKNNE